MARRTKGDGAFFQRGDGLWVGRVELTPDLEGNRRYRTVTSVDRNKAIAKLKKLRADVDAGRIATTGSTTVEKWFTRWIEEIRPARGKIRPGVLQDYAGVIRNHIVPAIGTKRLDKLTPQHIRDVHTAIGPSRTCELAHVVMQAALKDAVREGLVVRNVAELVDKPIYVKQKREGFTFTQAKKVITTAEETCSESDAIRVCTGFLTGERRGELLGLRWPYVDLAAGAADISWQLQSLTRVHGCGDRLPDKSWPCGRKLGAYCPAARWDLPADFEYEHLYRSLCLTRPKSETSQRWVPVHPALLDRLTALRDREGPNPHQLVWHRDDGRPIDPRDDYEMWRGVFRAAGIIGPTESLPPHNVRRTTSTLMRAQGVDEQTRMEIFGHASADVQRIYAGPDKARHLEAVLSLGELLEPESRG